MHGSPHPSGHCSWFALRSRNTHTFIEAIGLEREEEISVEHLRTKISELVMRKMHIIINIEHFVNLLHKHFPT